MTSASHEDIEITTPENSNENNLDLTSEARDTNSSGSQTSAEGVKKWEAEINELRDKNLRLYAEFENFRRRTAKESFELMVTANAKLIGKLTDVLDNFQRAFDPKNRGDSMEEFEKGMRLIHARFKEILEEEGLEEIEPLGKEFDPNLHEALLQQPSDTVKENFVLQTVQKGYQLKTKVIKHAKVIVSKGKAE